MCVWVCVLKYSKNMSGTPATPDSYHFPTGNHDPASLPGQLSHSWRRSFAARNHVPVKWAHVCRSYHNWATGQLVAILGMWHVEWRHPYGVGVVLPLPFHGCSSSVYYSTYRKYGPIVDTQAGPPDLPRCYLATPHHQSLPVFHKGQWAVLAEEHQT